MEEGQQYINLNPGRLFLYQPHKKGNGIDRLTVFPLIEAGSQIQAGSLIKAGGHTSFVLIEAGSLIQAGSLTEAGRSKRRIS